MFTKTIPMTPTRIPIIWVGGSWSLHTSAPANGASPAVVSSRYSAPLAMLPCRPCPWPPPHLPGRNRLGLMMPFSLTTSPSSRYDATSIAYRYASVSGHEFKSEWDEGATSGELVVTWGAERGKTSVDVVIPGFQRPSSRVSGTSDTSHLFKNNLAVCDRSTRESPLKTGSDFSTALLDSTVPALLEIADFSQEMR